MTTDTTKQASMYFRTAKPASIRLWHWLTFLLLTTSIITVIFGSTLFKTDNNISMVQQQVQEKGGVVTKDQAWKVAHEYSDKLWMLHKYIGFALSFLMLSRIIIEVRLSKEKKIASKIRSAIGYPAGTPEKKQLVFVQFGYTVFYLLFITMAITGLVLAFEDVQWLRPLHDIAEETH